MTRSTKEIRIDAPKEKVWEVLADLGSIYKWNPGVSHSHSTSDDASGNGATRHCDLYSRKAYVEGRAFDWREGDGYALDVYETNLPFKRNTVQVSVDADGAGAIVRVTVDYTLKFGPLGWLLNQFVVRRQLKRGMADLLAGLKYHLETGKEVIDRVPNAPSG